ncbi:hypothetical protein SAMN04488516_102361 [Desulfonauticus submarinus]|uniref:Uncharacterized protein n=1 Tax=Desulfonauticus submarinus TaxID=206665 RepID=A0A1H0C0M3_9BACT|nr:hypothetical protein [Desulfonauticus submarinus]SDN51451.1 hypothetical protein SAMN04488516_102361 [Desulfonauticus submarinus]
MGKEKEEKNISPTEIQTLIAGIFPNTRYFDARFDLLQVQIDEMKFNQNLFREELKEFKREVKEGFENVDKRFDEFKSDVNMRFEQVDKRFEQVDKRFDEFKKDINDRFIQVDKRFEQVDKRFEQVDKRFEQMIGAIDRLTDRLEYRDRDQRNFTLRMFSISIAVSILGVLGAFLKIMGIF